MNIPHNINNENAVKELSFKTCIAVYLVYYNSKREKMKTTAKCKIKLFLLVITQCYSLHWLEVFIGPSLRGADHDWKIEEKSFHVCQAQNLVESFGYPFESHEVVSQSGYILSLHRIPNGLKRKQSNGTKKPVALFQHGLVAASDTWLFRGPDKDLPYVLADAGYDVWLSNMRGNVYSRAHKELNPDRDEKYWDFSMHEVAYYDFPVILDYVLNLTKQESLFFLGHSIGSTVGLIFCSLRPEYNTKIKLQLALAPLVYVTHTITIPHQIFLSPAIPLAQTALANKIYNIFPRRPYFTKLIEMVCRDGMPTQSLCLSIVFLLVGADYAQFNTTYFPCALTYFPAGTSTFIAQHTVQMYYNGNFAALDYQNATANMEKYNNSVPPPYNLSLVTHPISLHYGEGDLLVTKKDMEFTEKKLPNPVGQFPVPFKEFNHMDFMWGTDAKKLLYDRLIVIMDKYR